MQLVATLKFNFLFLKHQTLVLNVGVGKWLLNLLKLSVKKINKFVFSGNIFVWLVVDLKVKETRKEGKQGNKETNKIHQNLMFFFPYSHHFATRIFKRNPSAVCSSCYSCRSYKNVLRPPIASRWMLFLIISGMHRHAHRCPTLQPTGPERPINTFTVKTIMCEEIVFIFLTTDFVSSLQRWIHSFMRNLELNPKRETDTRCENKWEAWWSTLSIVWRPLFLQNSV